MKIIIITGPPYSGKGTQCEELINAYDFRHISTGEYIRIEKENETAIGVKMSEYEEKGELVPDEIMKQFFKNLIEQNLAAQGVILDGYPRTIPQVEDLREVLNEKNLTVEKILNIEVPVDELLKRAKKRAETSDREDDKDPETHYKRIRIFQEITIPAIEFMKDNFAVISFDGLGSIKEITERIKASM